MLKHLSIIAFVIIGVGCASVERQPSQAFRLIEPTAIAFERDLYRTEASTVFEVADVQADVYDSTWQDAWQTAPNINSMTTAQAQQLKDDFYDFPIWRTSVEVTDDVELKDNLGEPFGDSIALLYRMSADAERTQAQVEAAYIKAANTFYDALTQQNQLAIRTQSPQKIGNSDLARSVTLADNDLRLSGFEQGRQIETMSDDSYWYASGLVFKPKMNALDAVMANFRRSQEQFLDAALLAYLTVDDENLYLVLGQNADIRLPPGVVDANGLLHVAHSYSDGRDLTLPVELLLYRTKVRVQELTD